MTDTPGPDETPELNPQTAAEMQQLASTPAAERAAVLRERVHGWFRAGEDDRVILAYLRLAGLDDAAARELVGSFADDHADVVHAVRRQQFNLGAILFASGLAFGGLLVWAGNGTLAVFPGAIALIGLTKMLAGLSQPR